MVASDEWPELIWSSWWSVAFVAVLVLIRLAWIVLTAGSDENEPKK